MAEEIVKSYSPLEEKLNVWTHLLGSVAALIALLVLSAKGFRTTAAGIGFAVYGLTLLFLYAGSAAYHAARDPEKRKLLRRFDHAAIYLLIAGTYTPLMLGALPDWKGYAVLAGCWLLGVTGLFLNFLRFGKDPKLSLTLYVIMGWLCMLVIVPLYKNMGKEAFLYLLWGGIAYTVGILFYVMKKEFCHAVWHLFTLTGSALQLTAVALVCLKP